MTAAEYEEGITRYLTGDYAVQETQLCGWRVKRLDRSSDAVTVSTFHAGKALAHGGIRLQADSPAALAGYMATWDGASA